jgi:hypothetical protein
MIPSVPVPGNRAGIFDTPMSRTRSADRRICKERAMADPEAARKMHES